MLQQLQQYLRDAAARGRTTAQAGPFLVTISEGTDHPFLSYAVPDDDAAPSGSDVEALVEAFASRGRIPRLEYLEPSAPLVLPVLENAGFTLEGRLRAMTTRAPAGVAVPEGFALDVPGEGLAAMMAVQSLAFGGDGSVGEEELARARAKEDGVAVAAVEVASGRVVAGGNASPPEGSEFSEIGGIAVDPAFRRRGLASALTAEIARRALVAPGVTTAFLTPADDGAAGAYVRAGFADMGLMLHVRRE